MAYCSAVAAVATSNVTLGSPGSSFDGLTLSTNPTRVLLVNQTTPSQNGVWLWHTGATVLTRPVARDPFAHGMTLDNATVVPVAAGGTTWGGSTWWVNTPVTAAITVDKTAITLIRQNAKPVQARVASSANVTLSSPGIYIDSRTVTDGAMTTGGSSTTLTCATSQSFTSADVGKTITVNGAGVSGANLTTTIVGHTSGSVVTLTTGCSTSVTNAVVQYGATLKAGDEVLLLGQTSGNGAKDNGLYFWNGSSSAMTRTPDPIYAGIEIQVSDGASNAHTHWFPATQGPIAVGTTALTFAKNSPTVFVTDLYTTLPSTSRQFINVDGYSSVGDGGHGQFFWNASYSGPSTPITIIPMGLTSGAWSRVLGTNNTVNVTWFGAKGDEITDDTAAIQAAINTLSLVGNGTIFFPATSVTGQTSYLTTRPIFLGCKGLRLEMDGNTQIKQSLTWHGPVFVSSSQFVLPIQYNTENITGTSTPLTYSTLTQGGTFYLLNYTPMSNMNRWGSGNTTTTTAPFTAPAQLANVTVQVASSAAYTAGTSVYIRNVGVFAIQSIPDSTHLVLSNSGELVASDVMTNAGGQVISSGANISAGSTSGYAGPTPGFTFECFVDPIINWPVGQGNGLLFSSIGGYGSNPGINITYNSVMVQLYNDQASAQTRLEFTLTLGGVTTTLQSGSSTIVAGTLTHVACTYDGVSTMSLYISGVKVATASVSGAIQQQWSELVIIGGQGSANNFPGGQTSTIQQNVRIAGIGLFPVAKYSGASFTPPTTVPTFIPRIACSIIDFANHMMVTGPGGADFGVGWVQATCAVLTVAPTTGITCWLQVANGAGLAYCSAPLMKNVNISAFSGDCVYLWASLYGIFDNCYFNGGTRGITLDGFSYRNRITNCSCTQSYAGISDGGINQYSWNMGIISGSQYALIDGGYCGGAAWNIVSNVFAGIHFQSLWLESTGIGGMLLNGQLSPAATVHDVFFQSDSGAISGVAVPALVATLYAYSLQNLVIEGGYLAASFYTNAPQLVVDSCTNVQINGCAIYPGNENGVSQPLIILKNQTQPVFLNSSQAFEPWGIPGAYTTFQVTHGSASVTASNTVVPAIQGNYCTFASQPNTVYKITSVVGTAITLNTPYTGVTAISPPTTMTELGFPWMPETGTAGQGPLIVGNQDSFGLHIVNMNAAAGMTLFANDFLWRTIQITDANSLLSGTVKITLPLIAGITRGFVNGTAQTLTFGAAAGGTVNIASGAAGRIVCDGTNWISAP